MSAPATTVTEGDVARPTLSVIIPSYNRCASLQRAVLSLYEQDFPFTQFEVIVVLDGSRDGSAAMLAELESPFHLSAVEQTNQGAAAARNHGADLANGEILVFLDDDMTTCRSFLAEHARAHAGRKDRVILGYFGCNIDDGPSYFADQLRSWWAAMFRRMREDGHRYVYTDLLSGNFSLSRNLFWRVGGFHDQLRHCQEDYELGYRLLAASAEFLFVEAAASVHHEQSDVRRALRRKFAEGMAHVRLGHLHPCLKPVLPIAGLRDYMALPSRIMMRLAFRSPALGDGLARVCESALGPLERIRRYPSWLRILTGLNIYWYWRGVAHELPSIRKLNEFLATVADELEQQPELIVRLHQGMAPAAACLDEARPAAASFFYGDCLIARIPPLPGSERLRGRHLKPLLWGQYRAPLLHALTQAGATGFPLLDERLRGLAEQRIQTWKEPE